jgi:N-acetyl-gamma-glutamyl-phosphate reductase
MSTTPLKSLRAGIVGFRGYSGAELIQILQRHSSVEPILLEHRADSTPAPRPLNYKGPKSVALNANSVAEHQLAVVFLATPPEVSLELTPSLLAAGAKVVDLSGAFRLRTVENYARWYKEVHTSPDLLAEAAYGLPEFYRESIRSARLVSNPGCYPTAANLALRPLLQAGLIDLEAGVICDAKSGVSGAGRKASLKTSFCEITENFSAYGFSEHRHVAEVLQNSGLEEGQFTFTAQLLPVDRGILESIYFRRKPGVGDAEILAAYQKAYGDEPFVRLYAPGTVPDLRAVQRTNFCDIGFVSSSGGRTLVLAAIDNLVKGAAGQAVQNMNLILGLPETEGIL